MSTTIDKPFKLFESGGIQVLFERGFDTKSEKEIIRTAAYMGGLRIETTQAYKEKGKKGELIADKEFEAIDQVTADKWIQGLDKLLG